jgi:cephalosporin hydroxylase
LFETKGQETKRVRYHIVGTLSAKNNPQAPCGAPQKHDHARNGRPTKELFPLIGLMIFQQIQSLWTMQEILSTGEMHRQLIESGSSDAKPVVTVARYLSNPTGFSSG